MNQMKAEKKRRTGRAIGSEPAPASLDSDSPPLESWKVKIIHHPMPIPANLEVPADEILKRRD
jgi:hypothetical protein